MGKNGKPGGTRQPWIDADIDRANDGRNIRRTLGQAMQDRILAGLAMMIAIIGLGGGFIAAMTVFTFSTALRTPLPP